MQQTFYETAKMFRTKTRFGLLNRIILVALFCVIGISVFYHQNSRSATFVQEQNDIILECDYGKMHHMLTVEQYYNKRKNWSTSNLGSILYKNIPSEIFRHTAREGEKYRILIWKHYNWLKRRHIYTFDNDGPENPLDGCSVQNCVFTGDDSYLDTADAVVVHTQKGLIPTVTNRNITQRWIFLNDESPLAKFSLAKRHPTLKNLSNVFNWTMTYRSDSDVPVPYGRTVPLPKPVLPNIFTASLNEIAGMVPYWNQKRTDIIAAILISNCGPKFRIDYLKSLKKHLNVDIHGRCSDSKSLKNTCPGGFKKDCKEMSRYLFYLGFENSRCLQYLTEKSFYHAYLRGAIPVIMGPSLKDCENLLPPNSFLHVDNYKSSEELAEHMKDISKSDEKILAYHRWRNNFQAVNEHGYFGDKSFHFCRVCEALNYNDGEITTYDEDSLRLFFDPQLTCVKS